MPLSKARQAEWMRDYRKRSVIPKSPSVIPKVPTEEDAFDPVIHELTDSILDSQCSVIPDWRECPNQYLLGHLSEYPGYLEELDARTYNAELDPYINPLIRTGTVIPNCPDGRYREPDAKGMPIYTY